MIAVNIKPWSPGGSFMVQKMAIASPIPFFSWLIDVVI